MKNKLFLTGILLLAVSIRLNAQSFNVATFNIRYDNPRDSGNLWVFLENKESGKKFYFFNVHFDHQGLVARKESAKLILQKIKEIAGSQPVIFTGDLNGGRDSEWYQTIANSGILKDSYRDVEFPYELNSSGNGFRAPRNKSVIDHIFTSKQFTASRWGILTDTYFGKFPSDHFPVMSTLSL